MRPDDFDALDEALPDELRAQLDALADRHASDPRSAVLRAADADALPPPLQASISAGLDASPWQQAIVRGATAAGEDAMLDPRSADRLLARIHRDAALRGTDVGSARRAPRRRAVVAIIAIAASLVVIVGTLVVRRGPVELPAPPQVVETAPAPPVAAPAPPTFRIPLDPAPVKLTALALVLRNENQQGQFADDAAPAFDAYRAGDHRAAADAFARVASRYPASVEVPFYLGVSRLMLGDAAGAATALRAARAVGEPMFRDDIAWYLAAAEERSGSLAAARAQLTDLCSGTSMFAARACAIAATFPTD